MDGKVHFVYKKVAMVEQFFDIIYSVHVEAAGDTQIRGRAGKHCGQKRTYRAVSFFLHLDEVLSSCKCNICWQTTSSAPYARVGPIFRNINGHLTC